MLTHSTASPTPPRRVVVLGSRGFVSGAAIDRLQQSGVAVDAMSSRDIDLTAPASVDQLAARLRAGDAVVFVSALTPDKGKDIATLMRNLQMGQHVCAALSRQSVAHVVYISSDAVYDDAANPVRETSCCNPSSFHGVMHLARERMLIETLRAAKVPLAILRPTLIYGPGDTHNGYGPNRFARTALKERRIALFGGGEEKRDHVFIDDVAAIVDLALTRRSTGVLNVATGQALSFRDAAQVVADTVGNVSIEPSPRANPITHRHFDVSAVARACPGFRFRDIREGVALMLRELGSAQPA
jgi:UDP-glucose 4-epimerase